ncbi:hypothetical protein V6N13_148299 [Hibiscus sabdariffa]|uniref:beta-ketoacyl-[acyl-carrier-protein] synthase I n=1 Tax=Hibiscus sabdariffa TaxID=183260 RepID=A0ABR2TYY6_9ROSI
MVGEVGVLLFFCSDSEFEEILTSVGVRRMRDPVPAAKKSSPCIICIDAIHNYINVWHWAKDRDGFKMGEGARVLEMESLKHAMKRGPEDVGVFPEDVNYINLHPVSTLAGDLAEINATSFVFGGSSIVTSTITKLAQQWMEKEFHGIKYLLTLTGHKNVNGNPLPLSISLLVPLP